LILYTLAPQLLTNYGGKFLVNIHTGIFGMREEAAAIENALIAAATNPSAHAMVDCNPDNISLRVK
jgi:hypothetical protein